MTGGLVFAFLLTSVLTIVAQGDSVCAPGPNSKMSTTRIRVAAFGEPSQLDATSDDPIPVPTAERPVLVRLHAAGVNPVETYIRAGKYAKLPELPYTPGGDGAGVVEAVAATAGLNFRIGDRVFVAKGQGREGTYGTHVLCAQGEVHPLPETVSFAQGAAIGVPYFTAYHALIQRCRARSGETVLIHGASGAVGLAAIQLAVGAGLSVVGTASSVEGRELVLASGAVAAFPHASDELREYANEIGGFNVLLEMLANANLGVDLTLMAPRGRIGIVGSRGSVEINPRDAMARELDILGVMNGRMPPEERAEIPAKLIEGLANGALRPVVREEVPLAEAARAHIEVMEGGARGNIVLSIP